MVPVERSEHLTAKAPAKGQKRPKIDDLWVDDPIPRRSLTKAEKEAQKKAEEIASLSQMSYLERRLRHFSEKRQRQILKTIWFLITCLETWVIAALATLGARYALREIIFPGFDIFTRPAWRGIQEVYNSGQALPWELVGIFAGVLFVTVMTFFKLLNINLDLDDHKKAEVLAKRYFFWIIIPATLMFKTVQFFFKGLSRLGLKPLQMIKQVTPRMSFELQGRKKQARSTQKGEDEEGENLDNLIQRPHERE